MKPGRPLNGPDPKDPPSKGPPGTGTREEGGVLEQTRLEKPRMFKCVLHNDDFTTMEFVVEVLQTVFRRTKVESTRIMLMVHNQGRGTAGVYTREVAESKARQAIDKARSRNYPLLVTTEPE